jgi:hypothetical protein
MIGPNELGRRGIWGSPWRGSERPGQNDRVQGLFHPIYWEIGRGAYTSPAQRQAMPAQTTTKQNWRNWGCAENHSARLEAKSVILKYKLDAPQSG